jgi:FMN phosphatase YigB (HAD superfamily)
MTYVALDVGNVLVHVDFQTFIRALSKQLNISLEDAEYFMNRTHSLHDMGLTKMSDELRDHFKIHSPVIMEELLKSWNAVITANHSMVSKMVDLMNDKELKVALLSNVGLEHAVKMSQILSFDDFFNRCTHHLSCQVGARKPSKLYYQSFLLQHPEFHGCAYLDDLQENIDMAATFGFRAQRFSLQEHVPLDRYLHRIERFILENDDNNSRWH